MKPGTLLLYWPRNTVRPHWPAVACSIDMVPKIAFKRHKLKGSEIPILLLHKDEVRFARGQDVYAVNRKTSISFTNEEANMHPGLRKAYECLYEAIKRPPSMAQWKDKVKARYGADQLQYDATPSGNGKAKRTPANNPASKSTGKRHASDTKPHEVAAEPEPLLDAPLPKWVQASPEAHMKLLSLPILTLQPPTPSQSPSLPPTQALPQSPSSAPAQAHSQSFPQASPDVASPAVEASSSQTEEGRQDLDDCDPTMDIQYTDNGRFPTKSQDPEKEEEVQDSEDEEDADDSRNKFMAYWLIGDPIERFSIPVTAVTHREHLAKMNILVPHGNNGWIVSKPSFKAIDPKYFRFVAEFLRNGDFPAVPGPEDAHEDEDEVAWRTYAGIWTIAIELCLEDLLELLVEKILALQPWPLTDKFTHFIRAVYADDTLPASMDADIKMRELIAYFLAQNMHDYAGFINLMKQHPVLEQDVHQAKTDMATEKLEEAGN